MSETNQPVVAEENIPATVNTPEEPAKFDKGSLSHADKMAILAGKGDEVIASKSKPAEEKPPEGEEEPKAKENPPAEPKQEVKSDDDDGDDKPVDLPKLRIKPRDGRELEVLSLVKQGKTFQDAVDEIYGQRETPKPKEEEVAKKPESDESPFKEVDDSIKKASSELSALEKQLEEAEEDADIKAVSRLNREIMRKEQQVENLKSERKQIESEAKAETLNAFEQRVKESADRVFDKYPLLKDADASERKEFVKYYQSKAKDPDYADVFKSPKWPELMAREFADETGLASGSPSKKEAGEKVEQIKTKPAQNEDGREGNKPEVKKVTSQPRQSPSKTLTTGDGDQSGSVQVSLETWQKDRSKMTLDEKRALLGRTSVNM